MGKRPKKLEDLLERVRAGWESGEYDLLPHLTEWRGARNIIEPEIGQVLTTGFHKRSKDAFSEQYKAWKYAIEGQTVDKRRLRIIVSFENGRMVVITAMDLDRED